MSRQIRIKKVDGRTVVIIHGTTGGSPRPLMPPSVPATPLDEPDSEMGEVRLDRLYEARTKSVSETRAKSRVMVTVCIPMWQHDYLQDFIHRAKHGPRKFITTKTKIITEGINLFYAVNPLPPPAPPQRENVGIIQEDARMGQK